VLLSSNDLYEAVQARYANYDEGMRVFDLLMLTIQTYKLTVEQQAMRDLAGKQERGIAGWVPADARASPS
jgi:hypothetical protein